jgi:glycosyltransferase involved in cell wall biosynthesis
VTTIRAAMVLNGLHHERRGAEVAFESLAQQLGRFDDIDLTLFGAGEPRNGTPYDFVHVNRVDRSKLGWLPTMPLMRSDFAYEELTFIASLARRYRPSGFDVTIGCGFPFTNLFLTRRGRRSIRPPHVYITENGDWPARSDQAEYRWFRCDGLVCTNREYFADNRKRWRSVEIPNGIDVTRFRPGPPERERLGLPSNVPLVVMVSAMVPYKRVLEAIPAVARISDACLVVAGDGELSDQVHASADELMPGRFRQVRLDSADMPALYRSADAVLHMALFEPFGNVYIESVACGGSLVAHRNSSTEAILDGVDCELIDTDDSQAVTAAIERAAETAPTVVPEAFRRRFDWASLAGEYRSFLHEVVKDT